MIEVSTFEQYKIYVYLLRFNTFLLLAKYNIDNLICG